MPKVPHGEFTQKAPYLLDGVVLVDPATGQPYKAGVTVQQVEGGFDPTGLSTEAKQDLILARLQELIDAFQVQSVVETVITDDELPPVAGQATATKQDQILGLLNSLVAHAVDAATFRDSGVTPVSVASLPLAVGASTEAKQDSVLAALAGLTEALAQTLDVAGTVTLASNDVQVSGHVNVDNAVTVNAGSTLPVSLEGVSTAAKQDAILNALATLLTAVQAPQPITDNGGSVTVDGTVGISGTVPVSLTSVPTHAVTQSGSWSVSVVSAPAATSPALTPYRNTALSATPQQVKGSAGRIYQYSLHNPNNVAVYFHVWGLPSASVTAGTTVPAVTIGVPAGSVLDGYWSMSPAAFASGITVSVSTNSAGTGAPTTGVLCQLGYV